MIKDINPFILNAYQLECLSYQESLVEFLWCLEDLKIVKYNEYKTLVFDDIKEIIKMFELYGFKTKLKEISL